MPDFTLCDGYKCPLRDACVRHNTKGGRWQSFFSQAPYNHTDEKCVYYQEDIDAKEKERKAQA